MVKSADGLDAHHPGYDGGPRRRRTADRDEAVSVRGRQPAGPDMIWIPGAASGWVPTTTTRRKRRPPVTADGFWIDWHTVTNAE